MNITPCCIASSALASLKYRKREEIVTLKVECVINNA
jgi:hypothetical protein